MPRLWAVKCLIRRSQKISAIGATDPLPPTSATIPSPSPEPNAPEHKADKPQSLEAAKVSVFADKPTSPSFFESSRLRVSPLPSITGG